MEQKEFEGCLKEITQGSEKAAAKLWEYYSSQVISHELLKQHKEAAFKFFKNIADSTQNPFVQAFLGWMYGAGWGTIKDNAQKIKLAKASASQNNSWGIYLSGYIYFWGDDVTARETKGGLELLKIAAEKNHPDAQFTLGNIYRFGKNGIPAKPKEALKYYTAAANQGHVHAQIQLGIVYWEGDGVQKDSHAALKWWQAAAQYQYPPAEAFCRIGFFYEKGEAVQQDDNEARKYYNRALELDSRSNARSRLKRMDLSERIIDYSFYYTKKNDDLSWELKPNTRMQVYSNAASAVNVYHETVSHTLTANYVLPPEKVSEKYLNIPKKISEEILPTPLDMAKIPEIIAEAKIRAKTQRQNERWRHLNKFYGFWALLLVISVINIVASDPGAGIAVGLIMSFISACVPCVTCCRQIKKDSAAVEHFKQRLGFDELDRKAAKFMQTADATLTKKIELAENALLHQALQTNLLVASLQPTFSGADSKYEFPVLQGITVDASPAVQLVHPAPHHVVDVKAENKAFTVTSAQLEEIVRQQVKAALLSGAPQSAAPATANSAAAPSAPTSQQPLMTVVPPRYGT